MFARPPASSRRWPRMSDLLWHAAVTALTHDLITKIPQPIACGIFVKGKIFAIKPQPIPSSRVGLQSSAATVTTHLLCVVGETRVWGGVRGCGKLRCVLGLGIVCVISAAAWVYLVAAHGGFWLTSQRLPPAGEPGASPGEKDESTWPTVAVVVPARNEADSLPATLPVLLAQDYPGEFRLPRRRQQRRRHRHGSSRARREGRAPRRRVADRR